MPGWLQVFIVAAPTVIGALLFAVLASCQKPQEPTAEEAELLVLVRELAAVFREWPDAFGVLDEIVAQFKTNTGHSMRDLLDRLESAATVAARAAESHAAAVHHLATVATLGAATGLRIEAAAAGVAADLDASHERADATEGHPGEAADAASRSPEAPENVSSTDSTGETNERS